MDDVLLDVFNYVSVATYKTILMTNNKWKILISTKRISNICNVLILSINTAPRYSWRWDIISKTVTMNVVLLHPEYLWDYNSMSYNPNITMDIIIKNLDKPWNWHRLSKHRDILDVVLSYPDLSWDWNILSKHPNLTMQIILMFPKKAWSWDVLSYHPNIGLDDIFNHSKLDWDFDLVLYNPSLTCGFMYSHTYNKLNKRRSNNK